ncbi:signal recognition particle receptor subunit beta [Tribolium castaneum]|uniref:Signal recognition particle receptor subunit beta n=1 Tax=Tribolium castaneum TaxID=7070 RepID=D6X187_TRICA|nr:PREDICTED: signal recognition particle receptor subunit beta [Tribolium castaneum]EFA10591.1 ADP-ribosylation factor-like protein 2 [Tribolium castaneum]|eukprot:XP_971825.1 PREDICTED: signal recognition particle receptor subunit beta [Tribolium castaneum]
MDEKRPVRIEDNNFAQILIAVLVIVVTLVLFVLYRRRKATRNCILLTGLCDSGKTLIFSQLVYEKFIQTHTSIKENIGTYIVNNNYLKIVDIPGHERLRNKFIEQYKELTRGIVFVVDSSTIQQDVRDTAEFLYNILVDSTVVRNSPNLLILCNKQDQTLAKGSNAVKSILEKELNTLRVTKSHQLASVDPKEKKIASLGAPDCDFSFACSPFKVDFVEGFGCSKNGAADIEQLKAWVAKIA